MVDGLNQALVNLGQPVPEQKAEKGGMRLQVQEVQVPQEEGWGGQVVLPQPVQAQLQEQVGGGQERAGGGQVLISDEAKLEFPIVNGIPNLKPDAGVPKRS